MEDLMETLKAQGFEDQAIGRITAKKERLNLKDEDPIFDLLIEMEWYLKTLKAIPESIQEASRLAAEAAESQANQRVQAQVHSLTQKLPEAVTQQVTRTLNRALESHLSAQEKTNLWGNFVYAGSLLLLVSCVSITLGVCLLGAWPSFFPEPSSTSPVKQFLIGVLHTPTYLTWGAVLGTGVVFELIRRIWFWRSRRRCYP